MSPMQLYTIKAHFLSVFGTFSESTYCILNIFDSSFLWSQMGNLACICRILRSNGDSRSRNWKFPVKMWNVSSSSSMEKLKEHFPVLLMDCVQDFLPPLLLLIRINAWGTWIPIAFFGKMGTFTYNEGRICSFRVVLSLDFCGNAILRASLSA